MFIHNKFITNLNILYYRFILEFVCNGSSMGTGTGMLNITETNPFKHLTHLALKFLPGTDTDIKKYLAECLKTLKVCCVYSEF